MPTLSNFVDALSVTTAVDVWEVKHVGRTLREAALVPKYGRGLQAAQLETVHLSQLLIGLLVGRKQPVHKIAEFVRRIGDLRTTQSLKVKMQDSTQDVFTLLPESASFLHAVTEILTALAGIESDVSWHGVVESIGIKFGSGQAYPWIRVKEARRIESGLTSPISWHRCAFGSSKLRYRVDTGGLTDESQVPNGILLDIALLLRADRPVADYISYLQKKHKRN